MYAIVAFASELAVKSEENLCHLLLVKAILLSGFAKEEGIAKNNKQFSKKMWWAILGSNQ